MDAFRVNRDFEAAIAEYTGAPYAVVVNSCTMALLLALKRYNENGPAHPRHIFIPRKTYPSVPMSAWHAGYEPNFTNDVWDGVYQLKPTPVWDCAKRFTSGMYVAGQIQCVSFHVNKHLKIGQGGAILHDDAAADAWYRKARFDGRTEGVPTAEDWYDFPAYHCYLSPDVAARGLWLMSSYPKHVPDQEMHPYPDLKERWRV